MARGTDVEVARGVVLDQGVAEDAQRRVMEAAAAGKQALWDLYEALYDFDEANGWAALGFASLSAWLNDPKIDMTRGSYYRAVTTWRRWVVEGGVQRKQLEGVSATKAALLDDEVADGKLTAASAIKDVQGLSANQLREKYAKPRRGRPSGSRNGRAVDPLAAARALPWEMVDNALDGDGHMDLRRARTREFLTALFAWRDEYLTA